MIGELKQGLDEWRPDPAKFITITSATAGMIPSITVCWLSFGLGLGSHDKARFRQSDSRQALG